jgi:hypothetical protein
VVGDPQRGHHAPRGLDLHPMALTVVDGERMALEALRPGPCQRGWPSRDPRRGARPRARPFAAHVPRLAPHSQMCRRGEEPVTIALADLGQPHRALFERGLRHSLRHQHDPLAWNSMLLEQRPSLVVVGLGGDHELERGAALGDPRADMAPGLLPARSRRAEASG